MQAKFVVNISSFSRSGRFGLLCKGRNQLLTVDLSVTVERYLGHELNPRWHHIGWKSFFEGVANFCSVPVETSDETYNPESDAVLHRPSHCGHRFAVRDRSEM
jgi:hypothetical protein